MEQETVPRPWQHRCLVDSKQQQSPPKGRGLGPLPCTLTKSQCADGSVHARLIPATPMASPPCSPATRLTPPAPGGQGTPGRTPRGDTQRATGCYHLLRREVGGRSRDGSSQWQTACSRGPGLAPEGQGCKPAAPWCIPGKIFTLGTKRFPQHLLAAKKGRGAGSQPLEQAAKVTAQEPAASTPTPRRGTVPRAGKGGRGERGQGQPETPRTDLCRHELHSQHPAPAPMQRGSRICPSSPSNTGVHLSLLLPPGPGCRDQTSSPAGAPLGRHLCHPWDVTSSPAPPPTAASASFAGARCLGAGCAAPQGRGRWHFPPQRGHPSARQRETPSDTHPTAATLQGAAHGDR